MQGTAQHLGGPPLVQDKLKLENATIADSQVLFPCFYALWVGGKPLNSSLYCKM